MIPIDRCIWRVLVVALLAGMAGACAHAPRSGGYSRFVKGNVPDYEGVWRELNRPPDESLRHFIARVRRLAAQAKPAHPIVPTAESTDPALREGLAALALAPTAVNHWHVAEAYRRVRIFDQAYDHLRAAVQLDPRFAAGWDGLARTWRDWGVPEYALADASRAVYFAPEEAAYRNTLGTVLQALGRWDEARVAYTAAAERAPGAAWVLNNQCALDLDTHRLVEARAHCAAATKADPRLRAARQNLARAEWMLAAPAAPAPPARADGPANAGAAAPASTPQ